MFTATVVFLVMEVHECLCFRAWNDWPLSTVIMKWLVVIWKDEQFVV